MEITIKKEYGSYCVETWDYYDGKSQIKKWEANTLEDVIQLVHEYFSYETTERGIKEITDNEDI